jgi:hypothetical protein
VIAEAGHVLQAVAGRGVATENGDALPRDLSDLDHAAGAGECGLVPHVAVDEVAFAAALVAHSGDQALALEGRDRLGDGRRADPEALDEFGGSDAARVRDAEARQYPSHHLGYALMHQETGERLLVLAHGRIVRDQGAGEVLAAAARSRCRGPAHL